MKKTSAALFVSLLLPLLVLLASCHPNSGTVLGHPPTIEEKVQAFSVQQGQFYPDLFSALLWPAAWSEADYEKNVKIVNLDSQKILSVFTESQLKPFAQINVLWRQFRQDLKCIETFHDNSDGSLDDPTSYSETDPINFVVLPSADPQAAALATCQSNIDARVKLHAQIDAFTKAENDSANPGPIKKANSEIEAILGKNSGLSVDTSKTRFSFLPDDKGVMQAKIKLGAFQGANVTVSNDEDKSPLQKIFNVQVSSNVDQLKFSVADQLVPGIIYSFNLVRVQPLISLNFFNDDGSSVQTEEAVFKGDVTMVSASDAGLVTRTGSAQIVGKFVWAPTPTPTPAPTPDPVLQPDPQPVDPGPTTPDPVATATPEPVATPEPTPTAAPSPVPTPAMPPSPTPTASPSAVASPSPQPSAV